MKYLLVFLFFIAACKPDQPGQAQVNDSAPVTQADTKPAPVLHDSVRQHLPKPPAHADPDSSFEKTIHGHVYRFGFTHEDEFLTFTVRNTEDSSIVFEDFLRAKGGDCNAQCNNVGNFELNGDSLVFYTYSRMTETWDVQHPVSYTYVRREIYRFRSDGTIVRIGWLESKKEDEELWKEIAAKLEKQIAAMD